MTRIAVVSDIHANLPALDAVIEDIAAQSIDEVIVGGDLVGRGPQGSAVVRRIAGLGWACVRGNHEDYLLAFHRKEVPPAWLHTGEWAASRWMAAELDQFSIDFIAELPFTLSSTLVPDLSVYHGSPRHYCECLGTWTSDAVLAGHLDSISESVLVCAHTHRPMMRELPQGIVANVGSVGLPFNGDFRAQYAIFDHGEERGWEVEFRQVEYPREQILDVYEASGFLQQGGVTAALLRMELETARPFLAPFLKWVEARGLDPDAGQVSGFLDIYDPLRPLSEFFNVL